MMRGLLIVGTLGVLAALAWRPITRDAVITLQGERGPTGATGLAGTDGAPGPAAVAPSGGCAPPQLLRGIDVTGSVFTCATPSATIASTTRKVMVRPQDFQPQTTTAELPWQRDYDNMARTSAAQAQKMVAAVHLPQGALVTDFRCSINDGDPSSTGKADNIEARLGAVYKNGAFFFAFDCMLAQSTTGLQVIGAPNPAINPNCGLPSNNDVSLGDFRTFYVSVDTMKSDGTLKLHGCEVSYTTTSMHP